MASASYFSFRGRQDMSSSSLKSGEQDDFKNHSKLEKFFKSDTSALKRLKSLLSFLKAVSGDLTTERRFFCENFSTIYAVVLDSLQQYDFASLKNKNVALDDIVAVLGVVRKILYHVPHMIKKRWQFRSIGSLISQTLSKENRHIVRLVGFELLLYFLDALGDTTDNRAFQLFANSLDFSPFLKQGYKGNIMPPATPPFHEETEPGWLTYVRSSATPTTAESLDLMKTLLVFMAEVTSDFRLWFESFKKNWIPLLYPMVCKELQLIPAESDVGFTPSCPSEIQILLINWLARCFDTPRLSNALCATPEDMRIVLEIFRQSFLLPLDAYNTIHRSLVGYRRWLEGKNVPTVMEEQMQMYLQTFIDNLFPVFYVQADLPQYEKKVALCQETLSIYNTMSLETVHKLEPKTWDMLLSSLLNAANYLVLSESNSESPLVKDVIDPVLAVLFRAFVRCQSACAPPWDALHSVVVNWLHIPFTIKRWRATLIEVTHELIERIYEPTGDGSNTVNLRLQQLRRGEEPLELAGRVRDRVKTRTSIDASELDTINALREGKRKMHRNRSRSIPVLFESPLPDDVDAATAFKILTANKEGAAVPSPVPAHLQRSETPVVSAMTSPSTSFISEGKAAVPASSDIDLRKSSKRSMLHQVLSVEDKGHLPPLQSLESDLSTSMSMKDLSDDEEDTMPALGAATLLEHAYGKYEQLTQEELGHLDDGVSERTMTMSTTESDDDLIREIRAEEIENQIYNANAAEEREDMEMNLRYFHARSPTAEGRERLLASGSLSARSSTSRPSVQVKVKEFILELGAEEQAIESALGSKPSTPLPEVPEMEVVVTHDRTESIHEQCPEHRSHSLMSVATDQSEISVATDATSGTVKASSVPDPVLIAWDRLLHIIGHPNHIQDPRIHSDALRGLTSVIDLWLDVGRTAVPRQRGKGLPPPRHPPSGNTLLNMFGPWLMDSCHIRDRRFGQGKAAAFKSLCRIFLDTRCDESLSMSHLAHFCRLVHEGLTISEKEVVWTILQRAWALFSMDFPGANVLIPQYIREIEKLIVLGDNAEYPTGLNPSPAMPPPFGLKKAALTTISSLICFPNHFRNVHLPDLGCALSPTLSQQNANIDLSLCPPVTTAYYALKPSVLLVSSKALLLESETELQSICLWALCVFCWEEVLHGQPGDVEYLEAAVDSIMRACLHAHDRVANAALQSLASLANIVPLILNRSPNVVHNTVRTICKIICDLLRQFRAGEKTLRDSVITNAYYCLLDWLASLPLDAPLLEDSVICQDVFMAIEAGLVGFEIVEGFSGDLKYHLDLLFERYKKQSSDLLEISKEADKKPSLTGKPDANAAQTSVQDAAEAILVHLLNQFKHFPIPEGPDSIDSMISEEDEEVEAPGSPTAVDKRLRKAVTENEFDSFTSQESQLTTKPLTGRGSVSVNRPNPVRSATLHFVYHGSTLISVMKGTNGSARLLLRDMTGKYVWDSSHVSFLNTTGRRASTLTIPGIVGPAETRRPVHPTAHLLAAAVAAATAPSAGSASGTSRGSTVDTLLPPRDSPIRLSVGVHAALFEDSPKIIRNKSRPSSILQTLLSPTMQSPTTAELTGASAVNQEVKRPKDVMREESDPLSEVITHIAETFETGENDLPLTLVGTDPYVRSEGTKEPAGDFGKMIEMYRKQAEQESELASYDVLHNSRSLLAPPSIENISALDQCRLLMSHLGLLSEENRGKLFQLDSSSSKLHRSLKLLDQNPGREFIKIGVIYCAAGQELQRDLLRNEKGSKMFEQFVDALGWSVNLEGHRGFMGGLDKKGTTGKTAPYYATSQLEVIFHVVTRMPTDWQDEQQITKKRHVGNDIVHIVWSEHNRDYRPSTITSQFNDVHIIIYPLKNELFRIQICTKPKVPMFGPLLNGMIINKPLLAPLVRLTAINANRAVRFQSEHYKRPYPTRKKMINELVERYIQETSTEEALAALFMGAPSPAAIRRPPSGVASATKASF